MPHTEELRAAYMLHPVTKEWRNVRHDDWLRDYQKNHPHEGGYAVVTAVKSGHLGAQQPSRPKPGQSEGQSVGQPAQAPPFRVGEILVLTSGLGEEVPQSGRQRSVKPWLDAGLITTMWLGGQPGAYDHALKLAVAVASGPRKAPVSGPREAPVHSAAAPGVNTAGNENDAGVDETTTGE